MKKEMEKKEGLKSESEWTKYTVRMKDELSRHLSEAYEMHRINCLDDGMKPRSLNGFMNACIFFALVYGGRTIDSTAEEALI